jgi:hypothetical protein
MRTASEMPAIETKQIFWGTTSAYSVNNLRRPSEDYRKVVVMFDSSAKNGQVPRVNNSALN